MCKKMESVVIWKLLIIIWKNIIFLEFYALIIVAIINSGAVQILLHVEFKSCFSSISIFSCFFYLTSLTSSYLCKFYITIRGWSSSFLLIIVLTRIRRRSIIIFLFWFKRRISIIRRHFRKFQWKEWSISSANTTYEATSYLIYSWHTETHRCRMMKLLYKNSYNNNTYAALDEIDLQNRQKSSC
jgi:hypothetical protein